MSFTLPKKEEVDVDRISFLGIMVPVVLPESKFHTRWSNIMVIPLVYELWAIPFRWAVTSPGDTQPRPLISRVAGSASQKGAEALLQPNPKQTP